MRTSLAAVLALGTCLTATTGTAKAALIDSCDATAEAAFRSCKAETKSDKFLALGKCSNITDPTARSTCSRQALSDADDALQTCKDEDALREIVCDRMGPAAYSPVIDPANFVSVIDNPYYPLRPGTTFVYEGLVTEAPGGLEHVEFSVTHATRVILGVTCVEIHDVRFLNGVLLEDTRDWFAQDRQGNVWYFGENTTLVDRGLPVDLGGTWTGGVDGAQPGIIMEAHPAIGDFYRQEFLLREAEDLAEVSSLSESVTVPYGSFTNCLKTTESSPIAPGDISPKFYAAGVGNLLTVEPNGDRSELVQIIVGP